MKNIFYWKDVKEAASLLKQGELVCFPTETVYGIGAIATSQRAFDKLVEAKRRPPTKPFTLMCSSLGQAAEYCQIDVRSLSVMKAYMPGEITVLVPARKNLPSWITLGTPLIGIRVPDSPEVLDLIEQVGAPLLVPSANKSGEKTATCFEEAFSAFKDEAYIIKGDCRSHLASTIVKMEPGIGISLVREGPIPFAEIQKTYEEASMNVSLACDHGAFDLKSAIRLHLQGMGINVLDEGTDSKASCDYPIFAIKAAKDVAEKRAELGVVCCTSGEGVCIAANKVKGIRCGIGYTDDCSAKLREHNNANVISFGAKYMKEEDVLRRVDIFLLSKFSPLEKHHRRVAEIEEFESRQGEKDDSSL